MRFRGTAYLYSWDLPRLLGEWSSTSWFPLPVAPAARGSLAWPRLVRLCRGTGARCVFDSRSSLTFQSKFSFREAIQPRLQATVSWFEMMPTRSTVTVTWAVILASEIILLTAVKKKISLTDEKEKVYTQILKAVVLMPDARVNKTIFS